MGFPVVYSDARKISQEIHRGIPRMPNRPGNPPAEGRPRDLPGNRMRSDAVPRKRHVSQSAFPETQRGIRGGKRRGNVAGGFPYSPGNPRVRTRGETPCAPRNFPHFAGDFPNPHPASWASVGKWPFSPILLNAPQYPNSTNRLETPRVNKGSPMRAAWKFLRRKHVRWPLVAARYPHRFYRGNRVAL